MHIRKLVKAGPSSHTVSLPKEWVLKNNLTKGSAVYVTERSDRELLVRTGLHEVSTEDKERTIQVDGKSLQTIGRELTSAYINNYSRFAFMGDSLQEKIWEIRRLIRTFIALEITEQKDKRLLVSDLLNLKEISIEKVLRRMDMIIRSMVQDSISSIGSEEQIKESITNKDYDVNRFYFLLYRLLKGSLTNPSLANHLKISQDGAFENWIVTSNLEQFADSVKNAAEHIIKTGKEAEATKQHYQETESLYIEAMKAHFTQDKQIAESIIQKREETDAKTETFQDQNLRHFFRIMTTCSANIARSVIDLDLKEK